MTSLKEQDLKSMLCDTVSEHSAQTHFRGFRYPRTAGHEPLLASDDAKLHLAARNSVTDLGLES